MYADKINKLISQMTFEEKLGQISQIGTSIYTAEMGLNKEIAERIRKGTVGSFLSICGVDTLNEMQRIAVEESRLKIPLFFAHDVIHGYRTIFPVPAGEACSFEPELAFESCRISAKETRQNGIHVTWAPMIDITRDQRWGRGFEGAGEDTYLGCEFAGARVRGFQHGGLESDSAVASCAKHFIGYGAVLGGKDYNSVDMSDNELYNTYLPPFREAINAGAEFVMTAFHSLNGVPCTANKRILQDILRDELGFNGIIISDANSLAELKSHGYAADDGDAALKALHAGLDIEMGSGAYLNTLKENEDVLKLLDKAVYKILNLKFKLGLFDNPYTNPEKGKKILGCREHMDISRNIAKRSVVLLENNGVLPLDNKSVALIGAFGDDRYASIGGWSPIEVEEAKKIAVTVREGLCNSKHIKNVYYSPGYTYISTHNEQLEMIKSGDFEFIKTNDELIYDAVETAKKADVVLYTIGEITDLMNGEAKSRASLSIPNAQKRLFDELLKLNKPIILLSISGRPIILEEYANKVAATLFSYSLGSQMGNAVADVITGEYNPSAKLVYTIPSSDGQCPNAYYSHMSTGRPTDPDKWWTSRYIDIPPYNKYCFGYGLSYTKFSISDFSLDKSKYKFGDILNLKLMLNNTGDYDGEEVLQIYMHDKAASLVRPIKQLIAFKKVFAKKGERTCVEFSIDTKKLGFYMDRTYILEDGEFEIFVGTDSNTKLAKTIYISN